MKSKLTATAKKSNEMILHIKIKTWKIQHSSKHQFIIFNNTAHQKKNTQETRMNWLQFLSEFLPPLHTAAHLYH